MIAYRLRQQIKALPGMLELHAAVRGKRAAGQLASPDKLICIEGFPRSGNSFALTCVRERLGVPQARIAHHTHSIANVRRAVGLGLATYVMLREPRACCESMAPWGAARSVDDALGAYEAYHRALFALLDQVTIVPFEALTRDPGAWLELVAADIGAPPPAWNEAIAAEISAMMKRGDERRKVEGRRRGSLPDGEKSRTEGELETPSSPLLLRCEKLREDILARAPHTLRAGDRADPAR
ncbi:MAG TPA: hypothetical protein VF138_06635 [Caulobacteraceae bacterium]